MRLAVLAAALALAAQTSAALAHATLVSSDPADGAVLATAPSRLVLTFNEPVSPLVLRLVDDQGAATTLSYRLDDTAVTIDRPGVIGRGSHALSWRVISSDGHPVGGSVLFSIGAPSAGGVPGAFAAVDWPVRIAIWCGRLAIYLGLLIGVGGVFFGKVVAMEDRGAGRLRLAALIAGLLAVPASIGLQGLDALDLPLSRLGQGIVWQTAMGTSWGATAVIAFLGLVAALAATAGRGRRAALLAVIAFLGVGAAFSASGHASAARPQLLARSAVFIHTMAVAFWIGALIPLAAALRQAGDRLVLRRFARLIPLAIVPLALSGAALAVLQVEKPAALWSTTYGRILLVKLALVSILLLLAAMNRWHLTGPAAAGDRAATKRLVLAICAEVGLAVAILGVVATWRFTPPPRSLEAAAARPAHVHIHIHTARAMADVALTPGRAGPVTASVMIMTGDLGPLDAKELTLILSNPAAGIEPIRRPATRSDDGIWRVGNLVIPVAGRWNIEVAILISDFEEVRLRETIDIRG
jgi:copper transport protein